MKELATIKEELNTTNQEAKSILATATSAALGGAFKAEADLRDKSAKNYFRWVVGSLSLLSVIGLILLLTHMPSMDLKDYIPRILLMVPITFIALVANKQLAVNRQAREEYAHKSSLSLSFDGFRKLVEDKPSIYEEFFQKTTHEILKNPAEALESSENEI